MKDQISSILGKEKFLTLSYEEYNELVSGYEKKMEKLKEFESELVEKNKEIDDFKHGLVNVISGDRYCTDSVLFISESEALKLLKKELVNQHREELKRINEELLESVHNKMSRYIDKERT